MSKGLACGLAHQEVDALRCKHQRFCTAGQSLSMPTLVDAESAGSLAISKFLCSWCTLNVRWRTNGLSAHKRLDDDHWRAAMRADKGRSRGLNARVGRLRIGNCSGCDMQQLAGACQVLFARVVGDRSIVADAMKAARQNVQQPFTKSDELILTEIGKCSPTLSRTALITSINNLARFSSLPPQWSTRWFVRGERNCESRYRWAE